MFAPAISAARALRVPDHGPKIPHEVQRLAINFKLGKFQGLDAAPFGFVDYNFGGGTIHTQGGRVSGAMLQGQNPDGESELVEIPDGAVRAARHLGRFIGYDNAMGGRISYEFERGFVNCQHDKVVSVENK